MTIVAAVRDGDVIVIGCDSAASDSNEYSLRKGNPKVWSVEIPFLGPALIGFAGTFSICQIIRYTFPIPEFDHRTIQEYLVYFQIALQKHLVKIRQTYEPKEINEYTLLFAAKGQIFTMYPNGDVEEKAEDFAAIGDGAQVALGALGALKLSSFVSWEKLEIMFNVVKQSRASVQGQLQFLTVGM